MVQHRRIKKVVRSGCWRRSSFCFYRWCL